MQDAFWISSVWPVGLEKRFKRRQACTVYGIEANPISAKQASERMDKVWNAHVEEIIGELEAAFFDCIALADILQHLIDPWFCRGDDSKTPMCGTCNYITSGSSLRTSG